MHEDKPSYIVGVDWATEDDKTFFLVIPGGGKIDVSEEIDAIRYRIAKALHVPVELIKPEQIRIQDHPAFNDGATVRGLSANGVETARWPVDKPNKSNCARSERDSDDEPNE